MALKPGQISKWILTSIPVAIIALCLLHLLYPVKKTSSSRPSRVANGVPPSPARNSYAYDAKVLWEVSPALIGYKEVPPIPFPKGFATPAALAADNAGNAYLADTGGLLVKISPSSAETARWNLAGTPEALTVDDSGNIAIAYSEHCEILAPNGSVKLKTRRFPKGAIATSAALDDENLYIADAGNRLIYRYSTGNGLPSGEIGRADKAKGFMGLIIPSPYFDIAISPDGALWAANTGLHELISFSPDGTPRCSWEKRSTGVEGFSGCCNPSHFAFMPDGAFITAEKNIPRVKTYAPTGRFLSVVVPPAAFAENAIILDVAYDSKNDFVLLLETKTKAIRRFEKKQR